MVNFLNTATIDLYLAFVKLWHVLGGLYIWEFFTTLDYEWTVIRGRRPYRWTIWIYSLTRVSTLMTIILTLVGLDGTGSMFNCQLWAICVSIFGYLSFSAALLLIVLRVIAIWNMNKIIIAITTSMWGVNLVLIIRAIFQGQTARSDAYGVCDVSSVGHDSSKRLAFIITFALDVALVFITFLGLFRLRIRGRGMFGLGRLLFNQGIIWLLFSTGAEFISVLFMCLGLNPVLIWMFSAPAIISMSITATRIYVSLTDFGSSANSVEDWDLDKCRRAVPNAKRMPVMHVIVPPEQGPTSQSSGLVIDICHGGRPCDNSQGLSLSVDSGVGK